MEKLSPRDSGSTAKTGLERVTELAIQLHRATDVVEILDRTASATREILSCDRAIVYRFLPEGDGVIAAESVDSEWSSLSGRSIHDPCFQEKCEEYYRDGRIGAIEDLETNPIHPCYRELLEPLQVKANLVVPVLVDNSREPLLWGLLIAHQCRSPRQWTEEEKQLANHIAVQAGIVLDRSLWQERLERETREREREMRERQDFLERSCYRESEELRWKEALLRSMTDTSPLAFFVVDNRTDEILYFNHRFCEIWGLEHLEARMKLGELKNNDVIPDCIPRLADLPAFVESCKPLQSEENRVIVEDKIPFTDGRIIRRFSCQIREADDRYFGRLYIFEDITERERVNRELQEYERVLRKLTEQVPGAICQFRIHPDGHKTIPYASEGIDAIYEYTPDQLKKDADIVLQRLHPDDLPRVIASIQQSAKTLELYRDEYRVILPRRGLRWLEVNSKPEPLDDGSILWHGYILDITERKRVEEALLESEERYRSLIAAMAEGIVFQDADGKIIACNPSAERILGLTREQMMGRGSLDPHWRSIREDGSPFPPEEHPAIVTLRTGQPLSNVIMGVYKPDGHLTWISINSQPLLTADFDRPHAAVTSFTDITARKRLELELQSSEAMFRGLFEQSTAGIGVLDVSGRFIKINQRFQELVGYSEAKLQNMTYLDLTHPDDRPASQMANERLWRGEIGTVSSEKRYSRADGRVQWVNVTASPIYDDRGNLQYVLKVVVDISRRKRAESLRQQQTERERRLNTIIQHLRQSLDLQTVLDTTVSEVRDFLRTDRVIIYRFQASGGGLVVAESVAPGQMTILDRQIPSADFVRTDDGNYREGKVETIPDIREADLAAYHLELLEQLQVRAVLVVPIFQQERVWGLLIAHHCRGPRHWQDLEADSLDRLAAQLAIAIQQSELYHHLQQINEDLQDLVLVDELTDIANRRCFDGYLDYKWPHLGRERAPISLLLCDIDYFKQYNDTYGHPAGDRCLQEVARILKQTTRRATDLVARYGGEEFAVVLPNTDSYGAIRVARNLQQALRQLRYPHAASPIAPCITLSIGVATVIPTADVTPASLIDAADRALYRAKQQGRNQYCV
ncbi:PAS domain S-box protein [Pannus brasiliensis CCIBt3594]|uniref:PAS domain S-box protein n=1 Tax=Pannus brasiliensis CCIBt3594 TaxID=1427578 RepID=A0AAW9QU04_9CHRO